MSRSSHRNPPLPPWFDEYNKGVCRYCGRLIWKDAQTINRRRSWHKECLPEYFIVSRPHAARRAVFRRDKGICSKCGKFDKEWQADHILRLADAPRELKYWGLSNLTTLCVSCHSLKSVAENAAARNADKTNKVG